MALNVLGTCAVAEEGAGVPALAVALAAVFAVYILLDSLVAFFVITRKVAEAESVSRRV
jgi:hypothetical protein